MVFKLYFLIIAAEVKRIFTIPSVFSIMVLAPFVYFFLYPQPYNNEVIREIPIGIINQDNSSMSRSLVRQLDATTAIEATHYFNTLDEAKMALEKQHIYGVLLIPFDFEKHLLAGMQSSVVFYGDASYSLIYGTMAVAVNNTASNLGSTVSIDRQILQGVDPAVAKSHTQPFLPVMATLFNPEIGYATFIIPPVFMLILHQMLLLGVSLVNINAHKTALEQSIIRSYPHPNKLTFLLISGKLIVYFFLYSFYFWFFTLFSSYWYELPQLGSFPSLFLLSCLFITVVSFAGLTLSFLIKKMEHVLLFVLPISMMFFFLAGLSWPHVMMPEIYKFISYFIPATPLMSAFVKINTMGADWTSARIELLNLISHIVVLAGVVFYLMRQYIKKTLASEETIEITHYDE